MRLNEQTRLYLLQLLQVANQTAEAKAFQSAVTMAILGLGLDNSVPARWNINLDTGEVTDNTAAAGTTRAQQIEKLERLWEMPPQT